MDICRASFQFHGRYTDNAHAFFLLFLPFSFPSFFLLLLLMFMMPGAVQQRRACCALQMSCLAQHCPPRPPSFTAIPMCEISRMRLEFCHAAPVLSYQCRHPRLRRPPVTRHKRVYHRRERARGHLAITATALIGEAECGAAAARVARRFARMPKCKVAAEGSSAQKRVSRRRACGVL